MKKIYFLTIMICIGIFITSCSPNKPDIEKIKSDLVGQRIPGNWYGCQIKSISEISDLKIINKIEQDQIIEYSIEANVTQSDSQYSPFFIQGRLIYKLENKNWTLSDNQVRVEKLNAVKN